MESHQLEPLACLTGGESYFANFIAYQANGKVDESLSHNKVRA
jgi:hypothetical protein